MCVPIFFSTDSPYSTITKITITEYQHYPLISKHITKHDLVLRREEKPTRCHLMVYCTYDTLNMFRALLCPSSGARDYMYYRLWCAVLGYWLSGVRCRAAGCESRKRDAARLRRAASLFLDAHPAALHLTPDNQQPSTAHHRRQ